MLKFWFSGASAATELSDKVVPEYTVELNGPWHESLLWLEDYEQTKILKQMLIISHKTTHPS